jgi:hypothetical protein
LIELIYRKGGKLTVSSDIISTMAFMHPTTREKPIIVVLDQEDKDKPLVMKKIRDNMSISPLIKIWVRPLSKANKQFINKIAVGLNYE